MSLGLGIDTGGTYTDAVLVDLDTRRVFASAKTLTTRHDLSLGIKQVMELLQKQEGRQWALGEIDMVGLSTTLATNAIVEGFHTRVCLLLIGYDKEVISGFGFTRHLHSEHIVFIPGGYDLHGNETHSLDEKAVGRAVRENRDQVDAFAVSCFFGSRNPGQEIRAREIVEKMCDLPVTCGHELTTRLGSVQRAQTVATNATLIPLLRSLMISVRQTLDRFGISAPLLVVKGDGSLITAELAVQRPVETILSGPAASIMGALALSSQTDAWIVDMGGTTTDMGKIVDSHVQINLAGATVGDRKTMVQAADIYTIGLGGDSHVQAEPRKPMEIGPRRVIPLCLLAAKHPQIPDILRFQSRAHGDNPLAGQFAVFWQSPKNGLSKEDQALLDQTKAGPVPFLCPGREGLMVARRLEALENRCLVQRSAFTPTDALHALNALSLWDAGASVTGAGILARRNNLSIESFSSRVVDSVCSGVAKAIITKTILDEQGPPDWDREKSARFFVANAIQGENRTELTCALTLKRPLVAIGAPADIFMPKVAEKLNADLVQVPNAQVANAVGAVAGSITLRQTTLITPFDAGKRFRAHLPDGVKDFKDLEEAAEFSRSYLSSFLKTACRRAGAEKAVVQMKRTDHVIEGIYLDTELVFIAAGRPAMMS